MQSNFNQQTSEGRYVFEKHEVLEALKGWCAKKGIVLEDKSITGFETDSGDYHFQLVINFNHKR
jgi:hypothetical protein